MDEQSRVPAASDETEDEDVEAHKKAASDEQGDDTDGDDDFELHKRIGTA